MNHDLIKKLEALTPTEGEWHAIDFADRVYLMDGGEDYYKSNDLLYAYDCPNDYLINGELASLAPTMRTEILAMAKEIEELKNEILKLKRFNSTKKVLGNKPKIQWLTACPKFEINPMSTSATICIKCGKDKSHHLIQ